MHRIFTSRAGAAVILLFAVIAVVPFGSQAALEPIVYTIKVPSPESHVAEIEISIPTEKQPSVELMMAVWSPGFYRVEDYAGKVQRLTAHTSTGEELKVEKPRKNRWSITTNGAERILVDYSLLCDGHFVTTNWIGAEYAILNGPATYITLPEHAQRPQEVRFELPSEWKRSMTSLDPAADGQPNHYEAPNFDILADSPIVAGNPTIHEFDVAGSTHYLVDFGDLGHWDGALAVQKLKPIVEEDRRLLGSLPFKRYLFLNAFRRGGGGLEHLNSTLLTSSSGSSDGPTLQWLELVSHEYFHAINVKRLRPIELGPFDYENPPRTASLWISEGLTSYYGDLAVTRSGVGTTQDFLEEMSSQIRQLQQRPGRLVQTLERSSLDVWTSSYSGLGGDSRTTVNYYIKGLVVGLLLDARIRHVTDGARSLDDVMRLAYKRYSGSHGFKPEEFQAAAAEAAGVNLDEFFERAVRSTKELDYSEMLEWYGLRFAPPESRPPDPEKAWTLEARPDATETQKRHLESLFAPSMPAGSSSVLDYAVSPVSYRDVEIRDDFWTPKLGINRKFSIPGLFERYEQKGYPPDLRLIEAACYVLAQHPDPALQARVDGALDDAIKRIRSRKGIWSSEGDGDFFWAGHFLELAAAHYETTGSRKLLDVGIEIGDDLDSVFGPGKRHDISNHEGIKIGLIRLYRATGDEKYLKLAEFFLDARGNPANRQRMYGPYAQDHEPVKSQSRAIGHTVRATYLYIPLTDIAALTGDLEYADADERIWEDAVSKRTFLTGGIGSYRDEEDFGDDFDLPNLACWNEICAAYGNTMWNQRLFQLRRDAKYVDMLERTLYNALLVGVSLDGHDYLYQAPLRAYGDFSRQSWFGPNCCPPNLVRLLPQMGKLIYATGDRSLYVNLFVGSRAQIRLGDTALKLTQQTHYPWTGRVNITVEPEKPSTFALFVRIPGWARGDAIPGGLYRYLPAPEQKIELSVNGTELDYTLEKGYARIEREWKPGDTVQLKLPIVIRRVVAADPVAEDRGMVALERGPLVYCAEQADNPGGVFSLVLPDEAVVELGNRDMLGGIGVIRGNAIALSRGDDRVSVVRTPREFIAIPYYAFGNRGKGQMSVWLAREESRAWIEPKPTIASTSKATSSCGDGTVAENYPGNKPPTVERRFYPSSQDGSGDIRAISDQLEPVNSEDGSAPFLRLHPQAGDRAWAQYDFAKPSQVSSVEVYWKDDKQVCVLPASWRLLYKDGEQWKPVAATGAYPVEKDRFNRVSFRPVETSGLRLEIQLKGKVYKKGDLGPPDGNYLDNDLTWYECGIIEWRVK